MIGAIVRSSVSIVCQNDKSTLFLHVTEGTEDRNQAARILCASSAPCRNFGGDKRAETQLAVCNSECVRLLWMTSEEWTIIGADFDVAFWLPITGAQLLKACIVSWKGVSPIAECSQIKLCTK